MSVGSIANTLSPQVMAALDAIQQVQAEQLAVSTQLEQGIQTAAMALNSGLGQAVNLVA